MFAPTFHDNPWWQVARLVNSRSPIMNFWPRSVKSRWMILFCVCIRLILHCIFVVGCVHTTPSYHVAGYPITSRVSSYCPVVTLVVAHSLPPTPDIYLEYEQYHAVVCFKADPLHKFTICLSYNLWHMSPLA